MAALTVKAIAVLGASTIAAAGSGNSSSISVSSRGKNASPANKQRQQTTARVAPIRQGSTEVAVRIIGLGPIYSIKISKAHTKC
uniref:Secreted protein n=1 Tax=Oryza meridionalis TaxID=40149 RepID=A0A0E0E9P7_9ORYZ